MSEKNPIARALAFAAALVFVLGVSLLPCPAAEKTPPAGAVPLSAYLGYARSAADWVEAHTGEILAKWRQTFDPENVFGYRPPGGFLEMAEISAFLYEKEKKPALAARAKKVLLTYGDYRSALPDWAKAKRADYADGVPALPDFFTAMRFIRSYETLHRLGQLTAEENKKLEHQIGQSMEYLLRAQEWGTMNRAALRAECLGWAVRALPGHPRARVWDMQRRAIGDDNWGNWQIEDASLYNAIWLYALISYAEAMNRRADLWKTPEWYYYAQYYLHLMSPDGMVPDFGDAHWESNWAHYLVFFEAAAAAYHDPALKWGAMTIGRKFIDFAVPSNIGLAVMLLDCYRWGTDAVRPAPPANLTEEVLEDVQGKKIIFRNGWGPKDTYLLLNYRDEGDGGLNFRDYLRDTIPVEEEKMTHGHADENSVSLLMSGGSVLLRDAGYRDYMPSGPFGAYRQDYFHNRLCVRPEKIFFGQKKGEYRYAVREEVPGQSVLEFLRDAGSYRRVRTQKVDFLALEDFDYSRTRVVDDNWGYSWDRVITYVKDPELFVVFDIFKAQREEWFTLANLWHTQKITARGDHWYRTAYEKIQATTLPTAKDLLIIFPEVHYRFEGIEPIKRHFQDELAIHQLTAQHFELGETVGFVTVLIPLAGGAGSDWRERIRPMTVGPERAGLGVEILGEGKTVLVAVKSDLRRDIARDWRRPRYVYEAGQVSFGEFETDGDFLFATLAGGRDPGEKSRLNYTIVNLTKALFRGQTLVEVKPAVFGLAYDGSPDGPGFGKLRYWRDEARVGAR
ncbi:MAG: hypothetical protein A2W03_01895 [Candidatus Aminicenantes bacterium RBG_16_63_16]|nr:MAG: hypothetical protein A2W03_01895 [Candidatus Aminicenantes bacterium RBG_16_63_16]